MECVMFTECNGQLLDNLTMMNMLIMIMIMIMDWYWRCGQPLPYRWWHGCYCNKNCVSRLSCSSYLLSLCCQLYYLYRDKSGYKLISIESQKRCMLKHHYNQTFKLHITQRFLDLGISTPFGIMQHVFGMR